MGGPLTDVDDALGAGDFRAASIALHPLLGYPEGLTAWRPLLDRFARMCDGIAGPDLGDKARAVADEQDARHLQALYSLGFDLIEHGLPEFAATFLARACEIEPEHPELVAELCAALEDSHLNAEAVRWLERSPAARQGSFLLRYLLAWNAVMSGDLARAGNELPILAAADSDERAMQQRISGIVTRADTIATASPLDGRDLRGWHFAINGSVLLHTSPYGRDEGMNGRYALIQDNEALCHEALVRLRHALNSLDMQPAAILTLSDSDSAALGAAAATFLRVPARRLADAPESSGLIVAYDLEYIGDEELSYLESHRPGQMLWSHASQWTRRHPIAADLVSYLYQVNMPPWGERLFHFESESTRTLPPDTSPPEVRATRVLEAVVEPGALDDLVALDRLARAAATLTGEHAAGVLCSHGTRRAQFCGGPVKSNQF